MLDFEKFWTAMSMQSWMPNKNSESISSSLIPSMILVMHSSLDLIEMFKELLSITFIFSKILLDDNLFDQFSRDNWELSCKSVASLVSIWSTVVQIPMKIFDPSFFIHPNLPTYQLLFTVLIMLVFMGHLGVDAGSKSIFNRVV